MRTPTVLRWLTLMVALSPNAASAQAPPKLRVSVDAPGCVEEPGFFDAVQARTSLAERASPGEQATALDVAIRRAPNDLWSGSIAIEAEGDRRRRELEGGSCSEVVGALALIAALAIDPLAKEPPAPVPPVGPVLPQPQPQPSQPQPSQPQPSQPQPSQPVPQNPQTDPAAPPATEPDGPDDANEPDATLEPDGEPDESDEEPDGGGDAGPHAGFSLLGSFVTWIGPAPSPLFGSALGGRVIADGPLDGSLAARLSVGFTGTTDLDRAEGAFTLLAARIDGCPFGWQPVPSVDLRPCAHLEGGGLIASASSSANVEASTEELAPWLAAGASGALTVWLGASWFLALDVGPSLPLVRREYVFRQPDTTVHEIPAVVLHGSAGAGVSF